jgi:hypothetical protein
MSSMTRVQWAIWWGGLAASIGVLAMFAFLKSGPHWYAYVFLATSAYCLAAGLAELYLRRARPAVCRLDGWISALSTARLGLVGIAAAVVVLAILIVFRRRLL